MSDFEQIIEKACEDQEIPGCVLLASNHDESFKYAKTFGKRSVRPDGDQSPIQFNTVMWIASCTKLMTSICAMQLVERGLLTLDAPIYGVIPELKDQKVLEGFDDDGKPIEVERKNPITLKLLLTHSSGLTYEGLHPNSNEWLKFHNLDVSTETTVLGRFSRMPLVFEPGTSWMYSPGIDFAGLVVERVSKMSLEEYMKKNLWGPLGVKDMTFHLESRPDMKARLADMSKRNTDTGKVEFTDERQTYQDANKKEVEDYMGGQGVFSSAEEYVKILHGLLINDENETILKKATMDTLFTPHLNKEGDESLNAFLQNDMANNAMGGLPKDSERTYALGGLVIRDDLPKGVRKGTMMWGGLPNLSWTCDRTTGLITLYAGQVVPPGDAKSAELTQKFQLGIYERYNQSRGSNARM
ncbi:beta-lactamase/transpeptidase-like protein [Clohesyomyces aquaticus]|uniref:Beta-lactamase/transpeptidase-like protein n=1 Tax=Clohesyomyces aquaticus TaxID=1231657 RepID=A0A1Y2A0M5_9PLEO|nr:beta-lactamase/transpeptidase-like protein [Clohesyomyces aquaticus]